MDEMLITNNGANKKKRFAKLITVVIAVLLLGVCFSLIMFKSGVMNPYEKDYIDVTGRTAEDLAADKSMDYKDFLEKYGLPSDMPKSTSERAVFYNIPVGKLVETNSDFGSFEELKSSMGWDDTITESTTMGDALDATTLSNYVGDEQLERFKTLYELPETVTGDTLYGEVRNIVDAKEKEFREADEKDK